ncbi:phage antirepressor KilAC domain-containing protein [Campylobacter sputorum]|uniref:phage antirepressor KilAC domain-containing protein n=1 Tax=Campylobacter sputorum TaxID=206 RepID=UPI000689E462|nr:phage antirepressor KilAC domain-containing protein [Campylobacter sputorum]
MQELVNVSKNVIGYESVNSVNARELWGKLESKQDFSTWIKKRLDEVGAIENYDYSLLHKKMEQDFTGNFGGNNKIEYIITLDLAKHFAMLERNEKGRLIRQYFIECERKLQSLAPTTLLEALELAVEKEKEVQSLRLEQLANKPYVVFAKAVEAGATSINIGDYAKILCEDKSLNVGQKRLFKWLRDNGYLMRDNKPYQKYLDNGYFEMVTGVVATTKGNIQTFTTKITSKGQIALAPKIENEFRG